MRSLAPLLLVLAGLVPLRAQWQIFAEKLPAPGTWASFRMETLRADVLNRFGYLIVDNLMN